MKSLYLFHRESLFMLFIKGLSLSRISLYEESLFIKGLSLLRVSLYEESLFIPQRCTCLVYKSVCVEHRETESTRTREQVCVCVRACVCVCVYERERPGTPLEPFEIRLVGSLKW